MKKRLLKKVVNNLRANSPARFRYNQKVEREWIKRCNKELPAPSQSPESMPFFSIDAKGTISVCNLWQWAYLNNFKSKRRKIALTEIKTDAVKVAISTVFLGIDMGFACFGGPPILFETRIIGGEYDGDTQRYSSYQQANAGHTEMVRRAFSSEKLILMPEAE